MKAALAAIGVAAILVIVLAAAPMRDRSEEIKAAKQNSADTYEHLATAIIEIRKTEDGLVKGIILQNATAADAALGMASRANGGDKKAALERAAEEITNAANEGDKPVQAIWIDGKEKKKLLDLAQRVSKMGEDASGDDINKARDELRGIMKDAVKEQ
jgi:hypothetical protein